MSGPTSFQVLGDRAPTPYDLGDAHGVAMVINEPGIALTSTPFRHPPLLDTEARVTVHSCGLCHGDLGFCLQEYGHSLYPMVIGHEIFGEVESVGEKVTSVQVGDRVGLGFFRGCCGGCPSCEICAEGMDNLCPKKSMTIMPSWGGLSTSIQTQATALTKVPESLPLSASPLLCAGATVYNALYDTVRPGMKVGVIGIGGLGHLALSYANKMGCEVTAFSRSPNKEAEAKQFGAHHFVNTGDPDAIEKAKKSVNLLLQTSNSLNIAAECEYIKPGGGMVALAAAPPNFDVNFSLFSLLINNLYIKSFPTGPRKVIKQALEFSALHDVLPLSETYAFNDSQAALNSLHLGEPHFPKYRNVVEMGSFLNTFTPSKN